MFVFSIPDYKINSIYDVSRLELNSALLIALKTHADWFCDDFAVESVYGSPAGCIWNGNYQPLRQREYYYEWIPKVVEAYLWYEIKYNLTFTNTLLVKEHLYDTYANKIAYSCERVNAGGVIVSTRLMADHIKEKYSGLKVQWSIFTDYGPDLDSKIEKINELSETDMVTVPTEFNNKSEILARLIHPENIEFVVNENCIDDCPMRKEHFVNVNKYILMEHDEDTSCVVRKQINLDETVPHHWINRQQLEEYAKKGFTHFKIAGRSSEYQNLFLSYCDYFLKWERREEFADFVNEYVNHQTEKHPYTEITR